MGQAVATVLAPLGRRGGRGERARGGRRGKTKTGGGLVQPKTTPHANICKLRQTVVFPGVDGRPTVRERGGPAVSVQWYLGGGYAPYQQV